MELSSVASLLNQCIRVDRFPHSRPTPEALSGQSIWHGFAAQHADVTWFDGESRGGGNFTRVKAMICWKIID